jgi:peptidoglycan/LPS O-acetylase OafA/YrhL
VPERLADTLVLMHSPFAKAVDRLRTDPVATGRTLPHLDGIRGMAVIFILVRHAWGLSAQSSLVLRLPGLGGVSFAPFVDMMSSGIDLFFVLSAYLLSQQFLRADFAGKGRPDLRRYYRTRFLRIAPPYWVVLILTLILFVPSLISASDVYSRHGLAAVLLHAVFLQTAWIGSFGIWDIATPFWTLTIEVMFYAVLPFVVPLFYRNRAWRLGLPLALATTVIWLVLCRWSLGPLVEFVTHHSGGTDVSPASVRYWLTQQIPASAFDFGMGIAMANLVVRRQMGVQHDRRWTSPTAGTIYAVVGAALALVSMWKLGVPALAHQFYFGSAVVTSTASGYSYYFLNQVAFALAYGLLIGGVSLGIAPLRRLFSISPLAVFGVLGYSVYLIHMQLLYHFNTFPSIFFAATPRSHFLKLLFAATPAIFICALGLYLAVERPFIFRSRRAAHHALHTVEHPVVTPDLPPTPVAGRTTLARRRPVDQGDPASVRRSAHSP